MFSLCSARDYAEHGCEETLLKNVSRVNYFDEAKPVGMPERRMYSDKNLWQDVPLLIIQL